MTLINVNKKRLKRATLRFKRLRATAAVLTPIRVKKPAGVKVEREIIGLARKRFNFNPPKRPLLNLDRRGKMVFKFPKRELRIRTAYAFYIGKQKYIGRILARDDIGVKFVKMCVWKDIGKPKLQKKIFKIHRQQISMNPWDAVGQVPRENPPKDVLYAPNRMERYKKSGGQKLLKGLRITPQNIEELTRNEAI